jgi:DNA-binding NarL/FixJ family response regulator
MRLFKRGLKRRVERGAVIFEASDPSEATRIVKQTYIDLILLDLELPDTDGFEFLREQQALLPSSPFPTRLDLTLSWYPTVSFVVVSERQDYDIFEKGGSLGVLGSALAAGAVGFIPKSASRETILDAFRSIFAGGIYFQEPPPPVDPCDGPVNPGPLPQRTLGNAQAVDGANRAAVVADSQGRARWRS